MEGPGAETWAPLPPLPRRVPGARHDEGRQGLHVEGLLVPPLRYHVSRPLPLLLRAGKPGAATGPREVPVQLPPTPPAPCPGLTGGGGFAGVSILRKLKFFHRSILVKILLLPFVFPLRVSAHVSIFGKQGG